MTEIGDPERRDIEIEPLFDPIPRTIPVAPNEADEYETDEEIEVEIEDPNLVPA